MHPADDLANAEHTSAGLLPTDALLNSRNQPPGRKIEATDHRTQVVRNKALVDISEPLQLCRRPLGLSYAAIAGSSSTARARTSGENLFVVLLVMAPSYLEVGASGKAGTVHMLTGGEF
jgi:hypothetical protein